MLRLVICISVVMMVVIADHRVHVQPRDDADRAVLAQLTDYSHLDRLDPLTKASITLVGETSEVRSLGRRLKRHAIPHRVRREDASFLFSTPMENDEFKETSELEDFDTSKYHSYAEQEAFLKAVKRQLGDACNLTVIGHSYQERPIYSLALFTTEDKDKPTVLIDAGIHAREWIAPATALYILKYLLLEDDELRRQANWVFAPNLNPDGYVFSRNVRRYWRKNRSGEYCRWANQRCCGTDLNRNFPFQWGVSGSSRSSCQDIFQGTSPGSEMETQSLMHLVRDVSPTLYLTLHSFGQDILIPYGYAVGAKPENYQQLRQVAEEGAEAMTRVNGVRYNAKDSAELYPAGGGSDDWSIGMAGVPYAYTIELRPNPLQSRLVHFDPPARVLQPTGRETVEGLKAMLATIKCIGNGLCYRTQ